MLLPGGVLEGALSPVAGRLFDRFGPRPLIIPGMIIVMGSLFWLSTIDEHASVWLVVAIHVIYSSVSASSAAEGAPQTVALAEGSSSAFLAAAVVAVVALVFSLFITRVPTTNGDAPAKTVADVSPTGQVHAGH